MTRQGIVLYHGIDSGGELKEYAETAERCGYESLWVTERYFHEETFSMLGFLAAATHDIKLGVGVSTPLREIRRRPQCRRPPSTASLGEVLAWPWQERQLGGPVPDGDTVPRPPCQPQRDG